jgi:hypothetical protein
MSDKVNHINDIPFEPILGKSGGRYEVIECKSREEFNKVFLKQIADLRAKLKAENEARRILAESDTLDERNQNDPDLW